MVGSKGAVASLRKTLEEISQMVDVFEAMAAESYQRRARRAMEKAGLTLASPDSREGVCERQGAPPACHPIFQSDGWLS